MPQNTKTYWRIPGETGIPTELDFTGSTGIAASTILWPYPTVDHVQGYLDYVYYGPTVLPHRADGRRRRSGRPAQRHPRRLLRHLRPRDRQLLAPARFRQSRPGAGRPPRPGAGRRPDRLGGTGDAIAGVALDAAGTGLDRHPRRPAGRSRLAHRRHRRSGYPLRSAAKKPGWTLSLSAVAGRKRRRGSRGAADPHHVHDGHGTVRNLAASRRPPRLNRQTSILCRSAFQPTIRDQ